MPNWCYTDIQIKRSASDGGVKPLYDALLKATETESEIRNDFGKMWLGSIVKRCLETDPDSDYECRGSMTQFDIDEAGEEIMLGTETAWGPMMKMWVALVEKFVPGADLLYNAEECGNEVYETNDPQFENMYYIDSWRGDEESDYAASEKSVRECVARITGKNCDEPMTINEVIELLYTGDDDYEMSIHKWDYNADHLNNAV